MFTLTMNPTLTNNTSGGSATAADGEPLDHSPAVPERLTAPDGSPDPEWIVTFRCDPDPTQPERSADYLSLATSMLVDMFPLESNVVVSNLGQCFHLTFQVRGTTESAIPAGVEQIWTAFEKVHLDNYRVVKAAQISLGEHDRQRGDNQTRLQLLNASDCARQLEVTRQRVGQMIHAGDFPEPDAYLGDGRPLWFASAIQAFKFKRHTPPKGQ